MKINALMLVAAFAIPTIAAADDMNKTETTKTGTTKTGTTKPTDKTKQVAKLEAEDLDIVAHANHVHRMEIDLGKLAKKNGTAKVKAYGGTLIKDHTAANKKVMAFAKKKGVAKIPEETYTNETDQKAHDDMMASMTKLETMKGAEFDREFLPMMAAGHDGELVKIDMSITMAKDPGLVTLLKDSRSMVQRHADKARELQKASSVSVK